MKRRQSRELVREVEALRSQLEQSVNDTKLNEALSEAVKGVGRCAPRAHPKQVNPVRSTDVCNDTGKLLLRGSYSHMCSWWLVSR